MPPTIEEVRSAVDTFQACLPSKVDAASFTLKSKNPFKAMVLREGLIHRVTWLAEGAASEFAAKRWIPAAVLTRAIAEPVAVLHSLCLNVEKGLQSRDDKELTEFLRRMMVGSRVDPQFPQTINVLTLVDKVDADFPGFRQSYDQLSEYAHPNWCGVLGAFSEPDRERHVVTSNPVEATHNTAVLMAYLVVAQHIYNRSDAPIVALSKAFDEGVITYPE